MTDQPKTGDAPLSHYVCQDPFDPILDAELTAEQERFYMASQWKLMWWKLRRHRLAVAAAVILLILYLSALLAEFVAPYELSHRNRSHIFAPPQGVHLFHEGKFVGPFVYGYDRSVDPNDLRRVYTPNPEKVNTIRFFCRGKQRGADYKF